MKKLILILMVLGVSLSVEAKKKAVSREVSSHADKVEAASEKRPLQMAFLQGRKIQVLAYDEEYDVFDVAYIEELEQGPFYFAPEDLVKAAGFEIPVKELSRQKKIDLVGSERVLQTNMKILNYEEFLSRKKK